MSKKTKNEQRSIPEMIADLERLQEALYGEREKLRALAPGKYEAGTVYTVRETRVRSYIRRGYTAVRVRR